MGFEKSISHIENAINLKYEYVTFDMQLIKQIKENRGFISDLDSDIIDLDFNFDMDTHITYKEIMLDRIRKDKLKFIELL